MSSLRRPSFTEAVAPNDHRVCGMMAVGPAREALLRRLEQATDTTLAKLRGVATNEAVVLLHEVDVADLPWVDHAIYLVRAPGAPGLLLPSTTRLDVPHDALLTALLRQHPTLKTPLALWPARRCAVSLASALPLDRGSLRAASKEPT